MSLSFVAPQMNLRVSYVEGHEDPSQVATDGQPPVAHGAPVFQHVLAPLLQPSPVEPSDDEVSSEDVAPSGTDAPGEDAAEESAQTAPPAPETTQTVLTRFASPVVPAQVTPSPVSAPSPAPPSEVKLASLPPETGRGESLPPPVHIAIPFQPPLVNRSPSHPRPAETPRWTTGEFSEVVQPFPLDRQDSSSVFQFPTIRSERASSPPQTDGSGQIVQKQNHSSFQKTGVVQSVELPRVSLQLSVEPEETPPAAQSLSVEKENQLPSPQRAATPRSSYLPTDNFIPPLLLPEKGEGTNVAPPIARTSRENIKEGSQNSRAAPTLRPPTAIPPPTGSEPVNTESEVEGMTEPTATFMDSVTTPRGAQPDGNGNEPMKATWAHVSALETDPPQSLEPVAPPFVPIGARTTGQTERQDIPAVERVEERLPRPAADMTRASSTANVQVPVERETKAQSLAPPQGDVPSRTEQHVTTGVRAERAQRPESLVILPASEDDRQARFAPTSIHNEPSDEPSVILPLRQGRMDGLQQGGQVSRRADRVRQESHSPTHQTYLDGTLPTPLTGRKDVPSAEQFGVKDAETLPPPLPTNSRVRPAYLSPPPANIEERVKVNHGALDIVSEVERAIIPSPPDAVQSGDNGNERMRTVRADVSPPETGTPQSLESFAAPFVPAVKQAAGQPRTKQSGASNDGVIKAQRLSPSTAPSPTVTAQKEAAAIKQERVEGNKVEVQDSPAAPHFTLASSIAPSKARDENDEGGNHIESNKENETASITAIPHSSLIPHPSSLIAQSNSDEQREPRQRDVSAPKVDVVGGAASAVVPPSLSPAPVIGGQGGQMTEWRGVQNVGAKVETLLIPHHSPIAPLNSQSAMFIEEESAGDVGRKVKVDTMSVPAHPSMPSESSVPFYSVPVQNHSAEQVMDAPESRSPSAPTAIDQLVMNQIVREARVRFGRGETEMTLRLQPPHLGRLRMRLVWSGNELTARMDAESQSVKQLIETHLPALYQALSEQGIRVDHVTVSVGQNFAASPFADPNPFANGARQQESMGQFLRPQTPDHRPQTPDPRTTDLKGQWSVVSGLWSAVDYWA